MKNEAMFYRFIYESVDILRRDSGLLMGDIALEINVSENFLKQIQQGNKHYNMEHLFILSKKFECSMDLFLPNTKMYSRIRESNQKLSHGYSTYQDFESALIDELRYDKKGGNSINE